MIRSLDRAVIDEVQRAPQLLLAIKKSVDEDRRPGRFLLTGSANLMAAPLLADSLAGRMETLTLLPLSQSEMHGQGANWIDTAFGGELLKHASTAHGDYRLLYYRDIDKFEVDVVIENALGQLVGVEVKAAATVTESDLRGLKRLAGSAGPQFQMGVLLYDGEETLPLGKRLWAAPLSSLWGYSAATD